MSIILSCCHINTTITKENSVDHIRKIRDRKQRTDIGKYSFVNRTNRNWTQTPAEALGTFPSKPKIFRRELGKQL
jgi:hypothetical protein